MLVSALSVSLMACTPDGELHVALPKTAAGPTVITFSAYGSPAVIAAYTRIASDFTDANPEVVVRVRPHNDHASAMAALRASEQSGRMPSLFQIGHEDLPRLLSTDAIEPVDGLLVEREVDFGDGFPRSGMNSFTADSRLQCMPTEVSPLVAYVNTSRVNLGDLLGDDEGVYDPLKGWSLDEFDQAAVEASTGKRRGLHIEPTLEQVGPMLLSGGGKVVDDEATPTTLALADESTIDPLQKILQVVRNPRLTFNQTQLERRSAIDRFRRGGLGIIFGYRDLTAQLRQQGGLSFAVLPIPKLGRQVTTAKMSAMCMPKDGPHAEVVGDFLAYLVSVPAMQSLATTGQFVPSNLEVVNSEAFTQPNLMPENAGVFADQIRRVRTFPDGPGWGTVFAQADKSLAKLFNDPVIEPLDERLTAIDEASVATLKTLVTSTPAAEE